MNSVCLSGYIKRVSQVRMVNGDNKVVSVTIATKRLGGKKYDYIKCDCWRDTAEYIQKYARDGEFVLVQGTIETTQWDDKDGKRVYETFVRAHNVQIPRLNDVSSKDESETTINEEGYVDVGRTSAEKINNMYKDDEGELPF